MQNWFIHGTGKMLFEEGKAEIVVVVDADKNSFFPLEKRPIWLMDLGTLVLQFVLRIETGDKIDNEKIFPCYVEIESEDESHLKQIFISIKASMREEEFLERYGIHQFHYGEWGNPEIHKFGFLVPWSMVIGAGLRKGKVIFCPHCKKMEAFFSYWDYINNQGVFVCTKCGKKLYEI